MSGSQYCKLAGTFGSIQIAAHDQAVVVNVTARNYDVAGCLHTDRAHLRLPLDAAYRLHALLAGAIVAAEATDARQPGLWGDATSTAPFGWRFA